MQDDGRIGRLLDARLRGGEVEVARLHVLGVQGVGDDDLAGEQHVLDDRVELVRPARHRRHELTDRHQPFTFLERDDGVDDGLLRRAVHHVATFRPLATIAADGVHQHEQPSKGQCMQNLIPGQTDHSSLFVVGAYSEYIKTQQFDLSKLTVLLTNQLQ